MSHIPSKLAIALMLLGAVSCARRVDGGDVIIDASDLLDEIPRHDLVMSASSLGVDWL